ncbi:MAG: HlyC/CorC family transporter [Clostridia bacterium]|nr:HlyC/CorC family transporter [Clostridia bacterium]
MENSIILMIGLQILLIALNAVFACAEIAVISMNDNKLSKMASEGDKRAQRLEKLTSQPARFLATIQVAITLSGFLGSAFAAENFSGVLVNWLTDIGVKIPANILDTISVVVITIVLSYFTLVFGELLPKQVAMRKAEKLALGMSGLISGISKVFAPLVSLLTLSTNGVLRLFGIDPNAQDDEVSEEEIRMMVDVGSEKGTIDDEEREFIQNVFDFDNLSVDEIVTHRKEVEMLDTEDEDEVWEQIIADTAYTYYPICEGTADKIIGVLNTKKYFRLKDKTRKSVMENAVSTPYFVPETLKADVLFRNMRKEKIGIAVVLDEYGGMNGIITIKDLIEELVGDIEDDIVYEEPDDFIEYVEENTWKIAGGATLEDISESLGVSLSCEEYDTLNGLIFHTLQRIPSIYEELEINDISIKVTEIQDFQVKTAIVKKIYSDEASE